MHPPVIVRQHLGLSTLWILPGFTLFLSFPPLTAALRSAARRKLRMLPAILTRGAARARCPSFRAWPRMVCGSWNSCGACARDGHWAVCAPLVTAPPNYRPCRLGCPAAQCWPLSQRMLDQHAGPPEASLVFLRLPPLPRPSRLAHCLFNSHSFSNEKAFRCPFISKGKRQTAHTARRRPPLGSRCRLSTVPPAQTGPQPPLLLFHFALNHFHLDSIFTICKGVETVLVGPQWREEGALAVREGRVACGRCGRVRRRETAPGSRTGREYCTKALLSLQRCMHPFCLIPSAWLGSWLGSRPAMLRMLGAAQQSSFATPLAAGFSSTHLLSLVSPGPLIRLAAKHASHYTSAEDMGAGS